MWACLNILSGPELSLSTYKLWLEAPAWFNVILNKDLICTITINNLKKNEEISRSGWEVNFTKKKLMEQIMECIGHIRSLAMSTTALYFVVNHVLPQGKCKWNITSVFQKILQH
ncbi:hypothetical protein AAG570_002378 [Ranatra chinensis]|uniref:Uncharacterized protein n=1 Tax=Ranatra chinensis TaxID=642074 RepID=A0ABD0YLH6_9HEMI